jgi:Protein of unknown function (DUF4254)
MMYDQARLLIGSEMIVEALRRPCPYRWPLFDLLDRMRRNHAAQWEAEDECRRPGVSIDGLGALKQRIDELNRVRTDLIDSLDSWVARQVNQAHGAVAHTETYGALLDRIVISALRTDRLRLDCAGSSRSRAAEVQHAELLVAYDALIDDVHGGRRRFPDWRSLKFYAADPAAEAAPLVHRKAPPRRRDAGRHAERAATRSTDR